MRKGRTGTASSRVKQPTLSRVWLPAALAVGLLATSALALTIGQVLGAPKKYDRRDVTLTGEAEGIRARVSHRGNPYTTFRLVDQTGRLSVFTWETPRLTAGERVRVRGEFEHVKHVGRYTFRNEVDATSVRPVR